MLPGFRARAARRLAEICRSSSFARVVSRSLHARVHQKIFFQQRRRVERSFSARCSTMVGPETMMAVSTASSWLRSRIRRRMQSWRGGGVVTRGVAGHRCLLQPATRTAVHTIGPIKLRMLLPLRSYQPNHSHIFRMSKSTAAGKRH